MKIEQCLNHSIFICHFVIQNALLAHGALLWEGLLVFFLSILPPQPKFLFQYKLTHMVAYFLFIMTLTIHLGLQVEFEMAFPKLLLGSRVVL